MIDAWFWMLVHACWQVTVVALGVAIGLRVMPVRWRYPLVAAAFAVVAAAAAITAWGYAPSNLDGATGALTDPADASWLASPGGAAPASAAPRGTAPSTAPRWVVLLWAIGAAISLLRQLGGQLMLRRHVAAEGRPLAPALEARAGALAARAGIARVRFVAAAVDVPFTYGWLRAVVVIPTALWTALPAAEVDLLLLHELVHVRRGDYLAHVLASVVAAVFFFHPAVWWLQRRLDEERELACDRDVVALDADPRCYARALTELAALRVPGGALAASGGVLTERVRALLGVSRPRAHAGLVVTIGLLSLVAACLVPEPADETRDTMEASVSAASSIAWMPPSVARHEASIDEAARRAGIEPVLLQLMVLVESGGYERAESPVGARGLLQLMPATAEAVAVELDLPFSEARLDEPAYSLRLGAHLVASSWASQGGTDATRRRLTWASYNAGPKAVRDHLEHGAPLPEETQRYIALLEELYRDRGSERSPAYEAWRARAQARFRAKAAPPLDGELTSAFGTRRHPVRGGADDHLGVDVAPAARGGVVVAPRAGVVEAVGEDAERGVYLVLRHGASFTTRYHHLADAAVTVGERVERGAPIGHVGDTGISTGPHLHFEVHDHGMPIDPGPLMHD